jgi:chromosome segregation ATPase
MSLINDLAALGDRLVALRDLDAQERELLFRVNAAKGAVAKDEQTHERLLTELPRAQAAVDAARAEAAAIVAQARADGETIRTRLANEGEDILAAAQAAVAKFNKQADALKAELTTLRAELAATVEQLKAQAPEVAAAKAVIAKAAEIKAVMG